MRRTLDELSRQKFRAGALEARLIEMQAEVRSDETTDLSATNQPIQGRIQIIKWDQLTKEALAGAEFTITRISGLPSHGGSQDGEVVAVMRI